ncbi:MAG: hypothetical protein ACREJQ_03405 [bacterium]
MATDNVRLLSLISIQKAAEAAKDFLVKCRRDSPDLKRALDILRGDIVIHAERLEDYGMKTGSFIREVNDATLMSELYDLADRLHAMAIHLTPPPPAKAPSPAGATNH